MTQEDKKPFFQKSYILKENFLSHEVFEALEQEAFTFKGEIREARQGATVTHRAVLSPEVLENFPTTQRFINNSALGALTRFTSGHLRMPFYYLEKVKNQYYEGAKASQKNISQ